MNLDISVLRAPDMATVLLLSTAAIFPVLGELLLTLNLTWLQNKPDTIRISVSFKVAQPTPYFQIKLDIWSQQNCYYPLKWHHPCLGCLQSIFYGAESGSHSHMCRMYPIPPLPKNIQSHLSLEVFSCHACQGLLSVHHYSDNTLSPSLPQSQDFFFKTKIDLTWEGSGIYNLGFVCILINFNWKISPLFLALLRTVCLFRGRKRTSARASNSILRVMDCTVETLPAIPHKYRIRLRRNT